MQACTQGWGPSLLSSQPDYLQLQPPQGVAKLSYTRPVLACILLLGGEMPAVILLCSRTGEQKSEARHDFAATLADWPQLVVGLQASKLSTFSACGNLNVVTTTESGQRSGHMHAEVSRYFVTAASD